MHRPTGTPGVANALSAAALGVCSLCLPTLGCTGSTTTAPTIPNPFVTADRVPPPVAHAAPAQAAPYYNPAPALSPAPGPAGAYPSPAPLNQAPLNPASQQAAPVYPGTLGAPQPAPLGRSGAVGAPIAKAGDAVAVPTDASPLRFGSPARPAAAAPSPNALAGGTANGWIAGSAPVRRPAAPTSSPLARIPGRTTSSEPLSLAALGDGRGQVQITPLNAPPRTPVSVADSQSAAATWR